MPLYIMQPHQTAQSWSRSYLLRRIHWQRNLISLAITFGCIKDMQMDFVMCTQTHTLTFQSPSFDILIVGSQQRVAVIYTNDRDIAC